MLGLAVLLIIGLIGSLALTPGAAERATPGSGPLPGFASIEALTEAVDPGCDWTMDIGDEGDIPNAWCGEGSLEATFFPEGGTTTVERATEMVGSPEDVCGFWALVAFGYSLAWSGDQENVDENFDFFGGPPLGSIVMGGNWTVAAPDTAAAERVVGNTGGYLINEPSGCERQ